MLSHRVEQCAGHAGSDTGQARDGSVVSVLDSLASLYGQLGGLGAAITLLIIVFFIAAVYSNVLMRRKYISLSEELAGFCAGAYHDFSSEVLQWITDEYKAAAESGTAVNTPSIIDTGFQAYLKPCMLGERFLRKAGALMITTGLFGTFVGLTYAVGNIGAIMSNTDADSLMRETGSETLALLVSSFRGMSVAFVTSLLGTGFSILHIVISTIFSSGAAKNLLSSQLEEYLDVKVAAEANEERLKKIRGDDKASKAADAMIHSLGIFEGAVNNFTENLAVLRSFNEELAANISSIKESASFLCSSLDRTSETVYESGMKIHACTGALQGITAEIALGNKRLEGLSSTLAELRYATEDAKKDRELFLKSVYEIPDRLLNYHEAAAAGVDRREVKA